MKCQPADASPRGLTRRICLLVYEMGGWTGLAARPSTDSLVGAGVQKAGGSIPSLATMLTLVESTLSRLFFCLCHFCAVDFPNQVVLEALILGRPLRIVTADYGGTVPENASNFLDGPTFP